MFHPTWVESQEKSAAEKGFQILQPINGGFFSLFMLQSHFGNTYQQKTEKYLRIL